MTDQQELLLECFIRCGYDEQVAERAYNFIMNCGTTSYLPGDDTSSIKLNDNETMELVTDGIPHINNSDYDYQSKWVTHATWTPPKKSDTI